MTNVNPRADIQPVTVPKKDLSKEDLKTLQKEIDWAHKKYDEQKKPIKVAIKVNVVDGLAIRTWAFKDAPKEFQELSFRKGKEAWVTLVPRKVLKKTPFNVPSWIKSLDVDNNPMMFETEGGMLISIAEKG